MDFNPLNYPIVFTAPAFISTVSAWLPHVPFAMLLVQLQRPRSLVELGTHQGDSYFGFCQAIAALNTGTRAFAVDTWAGDPQAGYYGEQVFQQVRAYHDPRYRAFSTLMRTDFDSAVKHFSDGSIDLLHIDGHHSYESVRHDYETWRPKVNDERGVILFHDTARRNHPGFGVWQIWDELSPGSPSFEFHHAEGLGVLVVGSNPPPDLAGFIRFANEQPQLVRHMFQALAQRVLAVQVTLRTADRSLAQWNALSASRVHQRGLEPLPQLGLPQIMQNPVEVTDAITQQIAELLQENQQLRDQLKNRG